MVIAGEKGKSYICNIKTLYDDPSKKHPNRAEVIWYFRYKELPRRYRNSFGEEIPHEKELFKAVPDKDGSCFPGAIEDIDAETIASNSIVKVIGLYNDPPLKLDTNEYFVKYGFKKTGELCHLKDGPISKARRSMPNVPGLSPQAEPEKGMSEFSRDSFSF